MEGFRSQKISVLLEKYKSIAAVLLKVESLVSGTGTYRSPSLFQYYEYWEKRIYNAIVVMIVRGLATMKSDSSNSRIILTAPYMQSEGSLCRKRYCVESTDFGAVEVLFSHGEKSSRVGKSIHSMESR